jgi:dedicated sortase system histidine kinase
MSRPRFWHRVRFKLLLASLTLLGIPWAGYRFIQETERFLREAQDQSLRTTASSVANIMHGEAGVFHGVARPGSVLTYRNLFLHPLDKPPSIDGYRDEWHRFEHNLTLLQAPGDSLEARIFLGRHGRYLYLLIGVKDGSPAFGDQGDTVELALTDGDGLLQRYRIRPEAPGWVAAQRRLADDDLPETAGAVSAIRGEWQPHPDGYTLEMRLPREIIQDRLSVRVSDSGSGQLLASGRMFPADALGRIVEHSTQLQNVLDAITPPATRVWVTDHQGLVLARAGRLDNDAPLSADQPRMPWFVQDLVLAVLPRDADAIADLPGEQTHLFISPVVDALSGRAANLRRQPRRGDAVVVSAAVPIRGTDGVRGAVLVEQTTNAILSIQNLALQRLFGVTLLFFAITGLGLLAFASLLASRITRLRDGVEKAVSHDGRILGSLAPDRSRDEIGDLSRSFSSVLARLDDYNRHLEVMASRLAHELRTPLSVVRTSLENAALLDAAEQPTYLARARDGAERLENTLARLREATGIEQAMRQAEPSSFDLAALLRLQTAGLRSLYPDVELALTGTDRPVTMMGVPDLISRALDKLVENAVDFHRRETPIGIVCEETGKAIRLSVHNQGPLLPADTQVFRSMVSGRQGHQAGPHLGLGLFLVKLIAEFHGGTALAVNNARPPGVTVTLQLPKSG